MSEHFSYRPILNRNRRVHVVESDMNLREQICMLFRLEGFEVTSSSTSEQFLTLLARQKPDVVVADLELPDASGLALLRRLKAESKATLALMVARVLQLDAVVMAMKLGAADVLSVPLDGERLLGVVREVLRRNVHVGALQDGRRSVEVVGFSQLTRREREVLQLITDGQSNKDAGRSLGISPRTVEVHRARVMSKMGARNTADLLRIVLAG